jgi:hypothetical protein
MSQEMIVSETGEGSRSGPAGPLLLYFLNLGTFGFGSLPSDDESFDCFYPHQQSCHANSWSQPVRSLKMESSQLSGFKHRCS